MAPARAYEINVTTAQKCIVDVHVPERERERNELVVPKGQPVKLIMSSKDVLHSFFVPEFRVKQDVVPGMYTTLWFEATENRRDHAVLHRVLRRRPLGHAWPR